MGNPVIGGGNPTNGGKMRQGNFDCEDRILVNLSRRP